jgi:TP901 family phage tail tape measure protein
MQQVTNGMTSLGTKLMAVGTLSTLGITVPILAIGAAAVSSAITVGGAYKDIQAQTGTTGAELEKLKRAFDTVYGHVPQDSKEVAQVISIVYDRLNELNYAIPETSKKFLDLARMTQEAPKALAESVSSMLLQWQVPASESAKTLDLLYTAYTKTHVPITTLTNDVDKQGQVMKEAYGFTLPETIALFATLNEQGISTSEIMRGMDYGWSNLTKAMDGTAGASKQMQPVVNAVNAEIKKLGLNGKDSGDRMAALWAGIKDGTITAGDATAVFGTRFSAQMVSAIKSGKLDYQGFLDLINKTPVSLDEAAEKTKYFLQQLKELEHRAQTALTPLGIAIIGVLKGLMPMAEAIIDFVTRIVSAFSTLPAPIQAVIIIIAGIAAALGPVLIIVGALMNAWVLVGPIVLGVAAAVGGLAVAFLPIIIAVGILIGLFALFYTQSASFRSLVGGAVEYVLNEFNLLAGAIGKALDLLMKGDWGGAIGVLGDYLSGLIDRLSKIDWGGVWDQLVASFAEVGAAIQKLFDTYGWTALGMKIGTFLGRAVVAGFIQLINLGQILINAITGATEPASAAGGTAGTKAGKTFGDAFSEASKGLATGISEQLARINIDWGQLSEKAIAAFGALGTLMGAMFLNAIAPSINHIAEMLHIPFRITGTEQAVENAKNQVNTAFKDFDLKKIVTIYADPAKAREQLDAFIKEDKTILLDPKTSPEKMAQVQAELTELTRIRETLVDPKVDNATKQVAMQELAIIAADRTVINNPKVDANTKSVAEAELTNLARLRQVINDPKVDPATRAAAEAELNNLVRQRIAQIEAQASGVSAVDALLNEIAHDRYSTVYVSTKSIGSTSAESVSAHAEGGIVSAAGGFVTRGPTMVLAGDNPGGAEAFVPLKGGKIPVELNGGATGTVIDVHDNTIFDDRAARKLAKTIADTIKHERGII